jgi:hypothetical protein
MSGTRSSQHFNHQERCRCLPLTQADDLDEIVITEIDIWRTANLLLRRYDREAQAEGAARTEALAAAGDHEGAAVWRRITAAVGQLANKTPAGPLH